MMLSFAFLEQIYAIWFTETEGAIHIMHVGIRRQESMRANPGGAILLLRRKARADGNDSDRPLSYPQRNELWEPLT